MPDCACTSMLMMVECDRFIDHVRERITAAVIAEIEAERAEDQAWADRVMYGNPDAPKPQGVLRA